MFITEDIKVEDTPMEEDSACDEVKKKQEWVKQMRLKFCIRPEFEITKNIILEDGTLNQE